MFAILTSQYGSYGYIIFIGTPPPQKSDSQSTDTSSQMEVEEYSQSEEKNITASNSQVDVDSGIENMEVEESKDPTHQKVSYLIFLFESVMTRQTDII